MINGVGASSTLEQRSRIMRAVKGRDTAPEFQVRRVVFGMGYRYRLYRKDLPSKPDLVFIGRRKVVFVHGCFWHGHSCRRGGRVPKRNQDYWIRKVARNRERDKKAMRSLQEIDWKAMVVWECETKDTRRLAERLKRFLG